uniref:Putative 28 kDa metastriate family member n=1 Tax=Rhipicephalus pulchellus TaxID=72859 RepID=L7M971_RHIPC
MNPGDLLVFTLLIAALTVSPSMQQTSTLSAFTKQKNKWALLRAGEGVTVRAHVRFDLTVKQQGVSGTESNKSENGPMKDFTELFQLVEQYFHNESVRVNFKVESATQDDNLRVGSGNKSLNATETLKKVIQYAQKNLTTNDSILYFFSESQLLQQTKEGDQVDLDHDDVATFGTFCSGNYSAAVVKYYRPGTTRHISAVEATARVFGLTKYKGLSLRDILQLLFTFPQCPRSECWMKCLQPDEITGVN